VKIFTIGIINSSEEDFFKKLIDNQIDTFCDIRQRRALQGSVYAFGNSLQLQEKLKSLNISYHHIIGLAPTLEIRILQKHADHLYRVPVRKRQKLDPKFTDAYISNILSTFDFDDLFKDLSNNGAQRIAFFCVEEKPEACHRSLVAGKIKDKYLYEVVHL
jgi:uncharacterized protein (DUF488 family)